jgi:DNA-binding XRE family transcriptional regulator
MKFQHILKQYRERARLTPGELANTLNISKEYIYNLENGSARKPPSIDRCHEIARALSLSPSETQALIDAAVEERLAPDELLWLTEREKKYTEAKKICTDEILEALRDPDSVAALLSTFQSKEDIKPIIQDVIWNLNHLSKEQRKEMLKYCQ